MIAVALFLRKGESTDMNRLCLAWPCSSAPPRSPPRWFCRFRRASLVNLAVALVALVWLQRDRIRWRRLRPVCAVFGFGGAAILWAAFPVFAQFAWIALRRGIRVFFRIAQCGALRPHRRVANARELSDRQSLARLLGVGYKTLPYSDFIGAKAVGDNTYLTLLAETGIAGLSR